MATAAAAPASVIAIYMRRLRAVEVWLMRRQRGLPRGLWRLVCLVALSAVDYGFRLAASRV